VLAPADAEIARRDPAIPGLALALDPEALADRLRTAGPLAALVSAQATYVRYKPGTSCLVGYDLELPGGRILAFAKAYRRGDWLKLVKARDKGRPGDVVVFDCDLVTVVGVAGDRDLLLPGRLVRTRDRRHLLRALLPESPDLWELTPRCLRYKPERRWVGVVRSGGRPVALVKGYRREDLPRACAGLDFIATAPLVAPRLLGTSAGAGALASSWIPGEALSEVLSRPPGDATVLVETGQALGMLHHQRAAGLRPVSGADDAAAVMAAAAALGAVLPRLGPTAGHIAGMLSRRLLTATTATPRHGDFSADQVVVSHDGVGILDLDNAAVGDPAADLGQFLANLEVAALDDGLATGPASSLTTDFLAGYESVGGLADLDRVALHHAAALVRLAVEPFRRRQPEWPARAEALLHRASLTSAAGSRP
jgi:aminoglycoside phosphotransferase (APT) family kinase protein